MLASETTEIQRGASLSDYPGAVRRRGTTAVLTLDNLSGVGCSEYAAGPRHWPGPFRSRFFCTNGETLADAVTVAARRTNVRETAPPASVAPFDDSGPRPPWGWVLSVAHGPCGCGQSLAAAVQTDTSGTNLCRSRAPGAPAYRPCRHRALSVDHVRSHYNRQTVSRSAASATSSRLRELRAFFRARCHRGFGAASRHLSGGEWSRNPPRQLGDPRSVPEGVPQEVRRQTSA